MIKEVNDCLVLYYFSFSKNHLSEFMNNPYLAVHLSQYFSVFFLFSFDWNYYHKNLQYIFNHLNLHQFHLVFHHQCFIDLDILSLILIQLRL